MRDCIGYQPHRFEATTVLGQEHEEQTCAKCGTVEERKVFQRDARGRAVTVGEWRTVRGGFVPFGRGTRQ